MTRTRWSAVLAGREPLPRSVREPLLAVLVLAGIALLLALFITEGFAVGAVVTVIGLLIVIAWKVTAIARKDRSRD